MGGDHSKATMAALEDSRRREKGQTALYRALAVLAELAGEEGLSERFNALLADEQHHLSRLTARILELGGTPAEVGGTDPLPSTLEGWEEVARLREEGEVSWYLKAVEAEPDRRSRDIFQEILDSEERHLAELGGKWMSA